ncbi:hypothetical protein EON71_00710 [bacterium]|nr:MAG: hypothetical protein EON71_00710 [bacterium]
MSSIKTHEPILVASSSSQKKTKRRKGLKKVVLDLLPPNEEELKKIKKSPAAVQVKKKNATLKYKIEYKPFTVFEETKGEEGNFRKLIYNQPKYQPFFILIIGIVGFN